MISASQGFINLEVLARFPSFFENEVSEYLQERFISDPVTRAYAENLLHKGEKYAETCRQIVRTVNASDEDEDKMRSAAERYYSALFTLASYLPMLPVIQSRIVMTDPQKMRCQAADISGEILIFTGNKFFGKKMASDSYFLKEDVSTLLTDVRGIVRNAGIRFIYGMVERIRVQDDFTHRAVEPLIWNALHHAFDEERDVYQRRSDPDFRKRIGVFGSFDGKYAVEGERYKGMYVLRVEDTGFGIPDDVLPHIFERGFTTRKDERIEHGIGLWGVKEFVEQQKGTIEVETDLRKGTVFRIAFPYENSAVMPRQAV